MYAIYAYIGVVWGVNGAAYMAVPWSVWVLKLTYLPPSSAVSDPQGPPWSDHSLTPPAPRRAAAATRGAHRFPCGFPAKPRFGQSRREEDVGYAGTFLIRL